MIQLLKLEIHGDNHSSLSLKCYSDITTLQFVDLCVFSAFVLTYFKRHSLSDIDRLCLVCDHTNG